MFFFVFIQLLSTGRRGHTCSQKHKNECLLSIILDCWDVAVLVAQVSCPVLFCYSGPTPDFLSWSSPPPHNLPPCSSKFVAYTRFCDQVFDAQASESKAFPDDCTHQASARPTHRNSPRQISRSERQCYNVPPHLVTLRIKGRWIDNDHSLLRP